MARTLHDSLDKSAQHPHIRDNPNNQDEHKGETTGK